MSSPADHPQFDQTSQQITKNYIFMFVCTTIGLSIFSDASPGWLNGVAFLVAGVFTISIPIAMSMFWLRFHLLPPDIRDMPAYRVFSGFRLPRMVSRLAFSVLDIAVPIGATWWSYARIFA